MSCCFCNAHDPRELKDGRMQHYIIGDFPYWVDCQHQCGTLNREEIWQLVQSGAIENVTEELLNPASLDVTMGADVMRENRDEDQVHHPIIDFRARDKLNMTRYEAIEPGAGFVMFPGEFCLVHSEQVFHMPNDVCADYKLKSSMARIGLEHLKAGWIDPGWHNAVLTLELKNMCRFHSIRIRPGDRIGQIVFHRIRPTEGYKGRYNNERTVREIKP